MVYIETERLIIRTLKPDDAPSVFALYSDPEIGLKMRDGVHESLEYSKKYIEKARRKSDLYPLWRLGIALKNDPETIIGKASLTQETLFDWFDTPQASLGNPRAADLSYSLAQKHWRKGIVSEAVAALINEAIQNYDLNVFWATAVEENPASWKLLEKLGFTRDGCLRKAVFYHGASTDILFYSLLADEFKEKGF